MLPLGKGHISINEDRIVWQKGSPYQRGGGATVPPLAPVMTPGADSVLVSCLYRRWLKLYGPLVLRFSKASCRLQPRLNESRPLVLGEASNGTKREWLVYYILGNSVNNWHACANLPRSFAVYTCHKTYFFWHLHQSTLICLALMFWPVTFRHHSRMTT